MRPGMLRQGDTIGLVAPASPAPKDSVEKAVLLLERMGYNVKPGDAVYQSRGYLAGCDEERAQDINKMFEDREVNAIFCVRGGYGSQRILDKLDYTIIRKNPKIFMGYSDITALLNGIFMHTGLITFHGPMLASDMTEDLNPFTEYWLKKVLSCDEAPGRLVNPPDCRLRVFSEGRASGILVGGNLSIITASLGTEYEIDTRDRILLLEDIGEEPYRIDRMLNQLWLAGKLQQAAAILLCDFKDCHAKYPEKSLGLEEVFRDVSGKIGKPVLYGYKIGHCTPMFTIPIGVRAVVDTSDKSLVITEKSTKRV